MRTKLQLVNDSVLGNDILSYEFIYLYIDPLK